MPAKIPEAETLALNMTPMIDIVFNLVQFFMLTLDMSHKDLAPLDLPRAHNGVQDKDPKTDPNAKPEDKLRYIINLIVDKDLGPCIYFRGRPWPIGGTRTPAEQDQALKNLRDELIALNNNPMFKGQLREADGASKLMVLVRGDRTTKWQYVQWIMQVCADPALKIYKIHFAVEHPPKEE